MANALRAIFALVFLFSACVYWIWNQAQLDLVAIQMDDNQRRLARLSNEQSSLQHGYLSSTLNKEVFHSKDLARAISYIPGASQHHNFIWQDQGGHTFAYAAKAIDNHHYFANSYLVGFEPYKTDKVWQPLVTLALRKTYQFDHHQHGPQRQDVWQNSQQAYYYSHGDCEDHALLLSDWLIAMGHDARVVIGKVPSGGHAWVALFHDGSEYVLEATSKRRPSSIRDFKLAKFAPDYQPEYMFNRTAFWTNTGPRLTTRYSGQHWRRTSTFTRSLNKPD